MTRPLGAVFSPPIEELTWWGGQSGGSFGRSSQCASSLQSSSAVSLPNLSFAAFLSDRSIRAGHAPLSQCC